MRSLPSSNRYNILAVLTQHGFDLGEVIEGEGNAGFYESGLANFQRVELMAGRFIGLSESVIYGLLKVNTAMHSRPPGLLPFSRGTSLFICLRRVHQQGLRLYVYFPYMYFTNTILIVPTAL
jgi:hypothetical protein